MARFGWSLTIWLRPKLMARALKERCVPDRERLLYLACWAVGPMVFGATWPEGTPRVLSNLNLFVTAGLTLAGMVWCFRAFPLGKRRLFADHFICLLVPIGVTVFFPFYYVPAVVLLIAMPDESAAWKIMVPAGWIVLLIIFWRLHRLLPESIDGDTATT